MENEDIAGKLGALGNPTRLSVYRLLVRAGEAGVPVGSVQKSLGIPGSTLTHHIRILVTAGLAGQEREGTTLICRARYETMHEIIDYLKDECCADSSDRSSSESAA